MRIGIVTISFNHARFLETCIRSVRMEDPTRLRYVIVDPGSTDGSRDVIEKHHGAFDRIVFEPDAGPADGLNKGFTGLDADVYGYINSDDYLTPRALDTVYEFFLRNPEVDVAFGRTIQIDETGFGRRCLSTHRFSLQNYVDYCCSFIQPSCFFRRHAFEATGGFNSDNRSNWDSELMVDMMLANPNLVTRHTHDIWAAFRLYSHSVSGKLRTIRKYLHERRRSQKHPGYSLVIQPQLEDYLRQRARICSKIHQSGISSSPTWLRLLKRLLFVTSLSRMYNRFP